MQQVAVSANGINFAAFSVGEGPLVICLHGFPDTPHRFFPLMEQLAAAGYQVVAPYLRGYYPSSPAADGDYSVLALARDLLALVEQLAPDGKAIVVGHDWGGFAAYTAANLQPERIRYLVQLAIGHMAVSNLTLAQLRKSWYVWYFQLPWLPERKLPQDDFAFIEHLSRDWSPAYPFASADFSLIKQTLSAEGGVHNALAYYRSMITGMGKEQWQLMSRPTTVPTLLVAGELDGAIGLDQFRGIEKAYSGRFLFVSYPGVGHFPQLESPERLARDILEFVQ